MQIIEGIKSPIKMWADGVDIEQEAIQQVMNLSSLPFIYKWVALMPDAHYGIGSTVGSVIATDKAIIPAAVGVDIGCGMIAAKTTLRAEDLPESLRDVRHQIERDIPVGFNKYNQQTLPGDIHFSANAGKLTYLYQALIEKHPSIETKDEVAYQLGTLGGGNHFIEICLDEEGSVWLMLHSGSRGAGNRIGRYFIEKAKQEMERHFINLPDKDLAYLPEGSKLFDDYIEAVNWAQLYAKKNREVMMNRLIAALSRFTRQFSIVGEWINCHHNYVQKENHYGQNVFITRKGAVSARQGQFGIIPGSMGAKSFIVEGLGNPESFTSCSHGAGRSMSRNKAKSAYSVEDLKKATEGVECKKDVSVLDEIPQAYKSIDAVMAAQKDLVKPVAILKQILCVKG
jgi:tRNA-splicing ligase RtcB